MKRTKPGRVTPKKPASKGKVIVGYPYPTSLSARFHHSALLLGYHDQAVSGHILDYIRNHSGANITNARNEIVTTFLSQDVAEWLLFIDTDMVFDPDLVDRMLASADKDERPILGALCFSLQGDHEAWPTVYRLRDDGKVGRVFDYERDSLFPVFATGTGCLMIHRRVFEEMRESGKFPAAYPWFQETHLGELPIGEDITFCIRAGSLGFPVYVDSSIKVGHEKTIVVGEDMFDAQQQARLIAPPSEPTYVVVPVRDRSASVQAFVNATETFVIPNGHGVLNLSSKWNEGLEEAEKAARGAGHDKWNVAILNDDLEVGPDFLGRLARGLRSSDEHWIAYPNIHGLDIPDNVFVPTQSDALAGQTMSGFAFMVRGESGLRFDEQFEWWYGDSDLERQVREAGKKTVCVGGCYVNHLRPMQSTRGDLLEKAKADERRFARKWHLSVNDLWLAKHPEFGA